MPGLTFYRGPVDLKFAANVSKKKKPYLNLDNSFITLRRMRERERERERERKWENEREREIYSTLEQKIRL